MHTFQVELNWVFFLGNACNLCIFYEFASGANWSLKIGVECAFCEFALVAYWTRAIGVFWWFRVGRGLFYCCFCKLALGANFRIGVKCSFCEFALGAFWGRALCVFYEFASGAHWPFGVLCVFCEFALGACLRTCVGHVRVGCVLGTRVGRFLRICVGRTLVIWRHVYFLWICVGRVFEDVRWPCARWTALEIRVVLVFR